MNILYHHRTRGKGAEGVHIMGVVNALRSLGHTVTIVSMPGSDPEAEPAEASAKQSESSGKSLISRLLQLTKYVPEFAFEILEVLYNLVARWRLAKVLDREPVDLIYERYSLFLYSTVALARKRSIPIILEVNDSAMVERVRPLFFRRLARSIEKRVFRQVDGLSFISGYFHDKALEQFQEIAPSVICPNAADVDHFDPARCDRAAIRKQYGIDDKLVCGYVGAFVYWHGIDWFVERIVSRLKEVPELCLLLVGDGVVYEPIRQLVEAHDVADQVILTGRVPHSRVRDYVAAMDFGILPDSNRYGSPMKLFEMMSMEVASVCPSFGPIAEVVEDGATGWLFKPRDKAAAVDKVVELAARPDEIKRVGQAARAYIVSDRQWTHNAEAVLGLLR